MNRMFAGVLAAAVAAFIGCRAPECGCACACGGEEPRISVFAHFVRSIAAQRKVSLAEAADMLYGLGVRGFDIGPGDKDLPELAKTKLKPSNFYVFPKISSDIKITNDKQFAFDLLAAKHILIVPGSGFDWPTPDHFRLVLLPDAQKIYDAVLSIGDFLKTYHQ